MIVTEPILAVLLDVVGSVEPADASPDDDAFGVLLLGHDQRYSAIVLNATCTSVKP